MARTKLPEALRGEIKALFKQGYDKAEVFRLVRTEGLFFLDTEEEL